MLHTQQQKSGDRVASGKDTDRICGRNFMWQFIFGPSITGTAASSLKLLHARKEILFFYENSFLQKTCLIITGTSYYLEKQ